MTLTPEQLDELESSVSAYVPPNQPTADHVHHLVAVYRAALAWSEATCTCGSGIVCSSKCDLSATGLALGAALRGRS